MTCSCGKPTRDEAYVCDDCLGELAKDLGNVPWLVEQLDITLTKARGIDYAADTTHTTTRPTENKTIDDDGDPAADRATILLYHQGASEALSKLRRTLATWVRFCDEESIRHQSPNPNPPAESLQAMSGWLLWRIDGLGLSDMGADAVTEIASATARCWAVIDRPAERQYAGPCECGKDLYSKPGAKLTKCKACDREYDVEAMREWMRAGVRGRLVTAREGTTLLGRFDLPTAQKTIDSWHERKRILDHGCNAEGRFLYLIDDLLTLAAKGTAA